jgi:hypothetical protein
MTEDEFTMDCPKCALAIAAPSVLAQERPVWDPLMEAFRVRIHLGPNDVEYQMHVAACEEREGSK